MSKRTTSGRAARRAAVAALLAATGGVAAGCRRPATVLRVHIVGDLHTAPLPPLRAVRVRVYSSATPDGGPPTQRQFDVADPTAPLSLTFSVVPRGDAANTRVRVVVDGLADTAPDAASLVTTVGSANFVPERVVTLRLGLYAACAGDAAPQCPAEETCDVGGSCRSVHREPHELEPYPHDGGAFDGPPDLDATDVTAPDTGPDAPPPVDAGGCGPIQREVTPSPAPRQNVAIGVDTNGLLVTWAAVTSGDHVIRGRYVSLVTGEPLSDEGATNTLISDVVFPGADAPELDTVRAPGLQGQLVVWTTGSTSGGLRASHVRLQGRTVAATSSVELLPGAPGLTRPRAAVLSTPGGLMLWACGQATNGVWCGSHLWRMDNTAPMVRPPANVSPDARLVAVGSLPGGGPGDPRLLTLVESAGLLTEIRVPPQPDATGIDARPAAMLAPSALAPTLGGIWIGPSSMPTRRTPTWIVAYATGDGSGATQLEATRIAYDMDGMLRTSSGTLTTLNMGEGPTDEPVAVSLSPGWARLRFAWRGSDARLRTLRATADLAPDAGGFTALSTLRMSPRQPHMTPLAPPLPGPMPMTDTFTIGYLAATRSGEAVPAVVLIREGNGCP